MSGGASGEISYRTFGRDLSGTPRVIHGGVISNGTLEGTPGGTPREISYETSREFLKVQVEHLEEFQVELVEKFPMELLKEISGELLQLFTVERLEGLPVDFRGSNIKSEVIPGGSPRDMVELQEKIPTEFLVKLKVKIAGRSSREFPMELLGNSGWNF